MVTDDYLYHAEWTVHKMGFDTPIEDPQAYLDYVCATRFVQNRWPKVTKKPPTVVLTRHRSSWYDYETNRMLLCQWGKSDHTILHELSHACAPYRAGDPHGDHFVQVNLVLVRRFMGRDAYRCLFHSLKAVGKL